MGPDRRFDRFVLVSAILVLLGACSARGPSPPSGDADEGLPAVDGSVRPGPDPLDAALVARLASALAGDPRAPEVRDSLAAVNAESGGRLTEMLARTILDGSAPLPVRAHALIRLGERREPAALSVFDKALRDPEPQVRIAAVVSLAELLPVAENRTRRLLVDALFRDEDASVQAEALRLLGDADAAMLRRFVAEAAEGPARAIAADLIALAESRGAPLVPDPASGELVRRGAGGAVVAYLPSQTWPEWRASRGELRLVRPGGSPVVLSSEVEVVDDILPAFFSPDGRFLVYEVAREIRVREIATGRERDVGSGIAPRPLPFQDRFLYFYELEDQRRRGEHGTATLRYRVLAAGFAGGEPGRLGEIQVEASPQVRGFYSPLRWARIHERDGAFFLGGEHVEAFPLPDPFGLSGTARPITRIRGG